MTPSEVPTSKTSAFILDRAKACLLGGAIGDSLGCPIEFLKLSEIRAKFGPEGIQELVPYFWGLGAWSDDTQMTLFTAEGLIRAKVRFTHKGICDPATVVAYAYQRWLHTQGVSCAPFAMEEQFRGWLVEVQGLHHRRAPGNTCLSALSTWNGQPAQNDSKGCGTVMRSAPFGFVESSWELAWECAAISHGHIEAKASAAIFAEAIRLLIRGEPLKSALLAACDLDRENTLSSRLTRRAIELAGQETPAIVAILELGEGWVAEEALAVAVYSALKANGDFAQGVRLAVNHDGDSDSTGAICGNLLGAAYGMEVLPKRWVEVIDLRDIIEQVATDLVAEIPIAPDSNPTEAQQMAEQNFWNRYPGC